MVPVSGMVITVGVAPVHDEPAVLRQATLTSYVVGEPDGWGVGAGGPIEMAADPVGPPKGRILSSGWEAREPWAGGGAVVGGLVGVVVGVGVVVAVVPDAVVVDAGVVVDVVVVDVVVPDVVAELVDDAEVPDAGPPEFVALDVPALDVPAVDVPAAA